MNRVKSRNMSAIGGWQFFEPKTGAKFHDWDFGVICQQIQAHYRSNPRFGFPTDLPTIQNIVDEQNATRMLSIQGGETYVQADPVSPKFQPQHSQKPRSAVGVVRGVATGAVALVDWIKSGAESVPQEQANKRAEVCASCEFNSQGDWTKFFTFPVSNAIRAEIEKRKGWMLSTPHDSKLSVCDRCLCPLPLLVHVPLAQKLKHMSQDVHDSLPDWCWVIKEERGG